MSSDLKRVVSFYTPNKKYSGNLEVQNPGMRTLDLMNSSNIYWKNPSDKSFNDALLLHDVSVEVLGGQVLNRYETLQLRIGDILFFSDELSVSGDETEKKRARAISQKTNEKPSGLEIITRMRGDSFYLVKGFFYGLFRNKSQQRFIPLMASAIFEVTRTGEKWQTTKLDIGNTFIGMSTVHIEACSIKSL